MDRLAQVDIGESFNASLGREIGIGSLVSTVVSAAIAIAGVVLLFLLVGGGFSIITGAGSDNPERVEQGKKAATSAIIGFIVVFIAYWIVRLVELLTGIDFITAPGL